VSAPFWLHLEAWRWIFPAEIVPSAVFAFAPLAVPESPRHLVAAGQETEALAVLRRIQPDRDEEKIEEIRATAATDHRPPATGHRLRFRGPAGASGAILPVVWISVGLSVLQQAVGICSSRSCRSPSSLAGFPKPGVESSKKCEGTGPRAIARAESDFPQNVKMR
jgi:SP family sugar:H+ symporter-like MFS transporter